MCVLCHGLKGEGNDEAGLSLERKPANFLALKVITESDCSIFWKITNGKAPMASYDELLSDDQRWKLVNYIRELGKKGVVRIKKNNSQLIIHNCFACSQNKLLFILFGSK